MKTYKARVGFYAEDELIERGEIVSLDPTQQLVRELVASGRLVECVVEEPEPEPEPVVDVPVVQARRTKRDRK